MHLISLQVALVSLLMVLMSFLDTSFAIDRCNNNELLNINHV